MVAGLLGVHLDGKTAEKSRIYDYVNIFHCKMFIWTLAVSYFSVKSVSLVQIQYIYDSTVFRDYESKHHSNNASIGMFINYYTLQGVLELKGHNSRDRDSERGL